MTELLQAAPAAAPDGEAPRTHAPFRKGDELDLSFDALSDPQYVAEVAMELIAKTRQAVADSDLAYAPADNQSFKEDMLARSFLMEGMVLLFLGRADEAADSFTTSQKHARNISHAPQAGQYIIDYAAEALADIERRQ